MRVFLDTNVLVAALATRGLCEDVLRTVLAEHELVVSNLVLQELEQVLAQKLRMPDVKIDAVITFLRDQAEVVEPTEPAPWPEKDPDDRWIVSAAMTGGVEVLVTGDQDLLEVNAKVPISIATPREFWEGLRSLHDHGIPD